MSPPRRDGRTARRRKVAVVTGTRAEYGLLQPVMRAIDRHPRLRLQLAVTGMHLIRKFGRTVDQIRRDGWTIDARVRMQTGDDEPRDQAAGLARGVAGLGAFFESSAADIVVVLGDRIEAMAGALACVATGRVLAHIHGGDVAPGDFDEGFRHAITKLAHIHFAATRQARRRIIRMGERASTVHFVGAPGLDELAPFVRCKPARSAGAGRALIVQHPCGRSAAVERRVMKAILRAVNQTGLSQTIVYPNSDRGHSGILAAIGEHQHRCANGRVRVEAHLPRERYLRCLHEADVLVGNSSSGIIEAAAVGTPCVNVGRRQEGRQRSGRTVLDAEETYASIRDALVTALRRRPITPASTVYGDGRAGVRIADILAGTQIDEGLRSKRNAY